MMGAFARTRCATAVLLLISVLLAPGALASDVSSDASLWAEFMAWFDAGFGASAGFTTADEAVFIVWLMSRLIVPGG